MAYVAPYSSVEQPRARSGFRNACAREYFIVRRRAQWHLGWVRWADDRAERPLGVAVFAHRSKLMRELHGVDMQLQRNKVTNLRIAIAELDGLIIHPGDTFSVWKSVGRPTRRKGYLEGLVLNRGRIASGVGGGLCQLGNLLYWMALHTPLTVVERWRHSYDVFPDVNRTLPFGSGATLAYNYVDLQLRNDTTDRYQINLWLTDTHLHGAIRCESQSDLSYEVYETDHCFRHQWWGGYTRHNRIWRRISDRSRDTEQMELVTENHAITMYEPLLEN